MPDEYRQGWIEADVRDEFPELRLVYVEIPVRHERSPPELKERLRELANGISGPQALALRQQPIPWAYRVFYRHIGLDPDQNRTPVEAAVVERLRAGGFLSHGLVADALTASLVETSVPVWALDTDTLGDEGELGIRAADAGETLGRGEEPHHVPAGRLAIVDSLGPVAVLFGELAAAHAVTKATRRATLFTVQVKGVPTIHVEEALYECCEWLATE